MTTQLCGGYYEMVCVWFGTCDDSHAISVCACVLDGALHSRLCGFFEMRAEGLAWYLIRNSYFDCSILFGLERTLFQCHFAPAHKLF